DTEYPGDYEPVGFLPGFRYPRQDVIDHLDAHDNAKLTPTLAAIYPDLADRTEIRDWQCEACSSSFPFAKVDWNEDARPQCPVCKARGVPATLIVPLPETGENDDN
ncbi:MAG: Dna2/Cas4 domain-containing protein, partial [Halobacteriaceae archaeon]